MLVTFLPGTRKAVTRGSPPVPARTGTQRRPRDTAARPSLCAFPTTLHARQRFAEDDAGPRGVATHGASSLFREDAAPIPLCHLPSSTSAPRSHARQAACPSSPCATVAPSRGKKPHGNAPPHDVMECWGSICAQGSPGGRAGPSSPRAFPWDPVPQLQGRGKQGRGTGPRRAAGAAALRRAGTAPASRPGLSCCLIPGIFVPRHNPGCIWGRCPLGSAQCRGSAVLPTCRAPSPHPSPHLPLSTPFLGCQCTFWGVPIAPHSRDITWCSPTWLPGRRMGTFWFQPRTQRDNKSQHPSPCSHRPP